MDGAHLGVVSSTPKEKGRPKAAQIISGVQVPANQGAAARAPTDVSSESGTVVTIALGLDLVGVIGIKRVVEAVPTLFLVSVTARCWID